jgi:hypothetical protein
VKEPLAREASVQISSLAHHILTALLLSLVRDPLRAQGLIEDEAAPSMTELAAEGQRIIQALGDPREAGLFASSPSLLTTVLDRVPPGAAREYFRRDQQRGVI